MPGHSAPTLPPVASHQATERTDLIDPEAPDLSEQKFAASLEGSAAVETGSYEGDSAHSPNAKSVPAATQIVAAPSAVAEPCAPEPEQATEADAWRDELSLRLNRYRARRKIRPPRYPSLQLRFEPPEPYAESQPALSLSSEIFTPLSQHALALDGMREVPVAADRAGAEAKPDPPAPSQPEPVSLERASAKILEFPRFAWDPPAPPEDQLAEPVTDRPRILEAPEIVPPPPALGGITIEPPEPGSAEKRPGIEIPLQVALPSRRLLATGVDLIIVALASVLFGAIFWKVAAVRPPLIQILGLGVGIPCLLWAAYQYLLLVYAANTPGLWFAGLELARFDGSRPGRSLRRWRVLASCLSAASLGLGYVWVLVDEDVLCWHDRITHTYFAPKNSPASK